MKSTRCLSVAILVISLFFQGVSLADDIPDLTKTPGVVVHGQTKGKICSTKWGIDARHVTAAMKQQVFAAYGYSGNGDPKCVQDARGRRCEVDHLISRELGGADDVKNLWPEAYGTKPWNAQLKDKLENRLHKEVCAGHISLKKDQDMISHDWRVAYKQYYGEP